MDYGKALEFVFKDKDWIGVILIGGGLGLLSLFFVWTIIIPILVAAVLLGYMMQLIRDVRDNPSAGLPEWTDWGKKLGDGLSLMIVLFLWSLPLILLAIPLIFFILLAVSFPDSEAIIFISAIVTVATGIVMLLYVIMWVFLQPAITINLSIRKKFSAGFDISAIFRMTWSHIVDVLIILIILFGLQYVANFIGMLLFFIGIPFVAFWVMLVRGHLYGQLARLAIPPEGEQATDLQKTS